MGPSYKTKNKNQSQALEKGKHSDIQKKTKNKKGCMIYQYFVYTFWHKLGKTDKTESLTS